MVLYNVKARSFESPLRFSSTIAPIASIATTAIKFNGKVLCHHTDFLSYFYGSVFKVWQGQERCEKSEP